MWFLIPGPFRIVRGLTPRHRRRRRTTRTRRVVAPPEQLTDRERLWWSIAGAALIGLFVTAGNPQNRIWFVVGLVLLAAAVGTGIVVILISRRNAHHYEPPPRSGPVD